MSVVPLPPAPVDPALAGLVAAVDALLETPVGELADETVLERQRVLMAQIERLQLAAHEGLRAIDSRELYALDGAGSASRWLFQEPVTTTGLSLQAARAVTALPHAREEVAAGRLTVRDARSIAAALAKVPDSVDDAAVVAVVTDGVGGLVTALYGGDGPATAGLAGRLAELAGQPWPARARLEQAFVTLAQHVACSVASGRLPALLVDLVDALLPDEHDERARRLYEQRHLDLGHLYPGGWHVRGLLDDETGELLDIVTDLFAGGDDPRPLGHGRSRGNRRHDGLRSALRFCLDHTGGRPTRPESEAAESGDSGGVAAPVPSQPDGDRYAGPPGGPLARVGTTARQLVVIALTAAVEHRPGALPARLGGGARLAPAQTDRLACGASLARILLRPDSRPLDVGHARRLATPAQRLALDAQWAGRCAAAGCPNPWTVPHHAQPWADGGPTDLANLVPLCEVNHHDIHTGKRVIRLKDGRWLGPDGWSRPP